jgi:hypothetical protein
MFLSSFFHHVIIVFLRVLVSVSALCAIDLALTWRADRRRRSGRGMASQLVVCSLVLHDYHKVMGLSMQWWLDVASFVCQLM